MVTGCIGHFCQEAIDAVAKLKRELCGIDIRRELDIELFDIPAPVVLRVPDKTMGSPEELPGADKMKLAELGIVGQVFIDASDAGGHFDIDGQGFADRVGVTEESFGGGSGRGA